MRTWYDAELADVTEVRSAIESSPLSAFSPSEVHEGTLDSSPPEILGSETRLERVPFDPSQISDASFAARLMVFDMSELTGRSQTYEGSSRPDDAGYNGSASSNDEPYVFPEELEMQDDEFDFEACQSNPRARPPC